MWEYFISGVFAILGTGLGSFITWRMESTKHLNELEKFKIQLEIEAYQSYLSAVSEITNKITDVEDDYDAGPDFYFFIGEPASSLARLNDARHNPLIVSDKIVEDSYDKFQELSYKVSGDGALQIGWESVEAIIKDAEKQRDDITCHISKKILAQLNKQKGSI